MISFIKRFQIGKAKPCGLGMKIEVIDLENNVVKWVSQKSR